MRERSSASEVNVEGDNWTVLKSRFHKAETLAIRMQLTYSGILLSLFLGLQRIHVIDGAWSYSDVQTIRSTILASASYSPVVRPSDTVIVRAGLSVLTINQLDIKAQTLSLTGWITADWTDARLAWSNTTYPDVTSLHMTEAEVWKPEFFVDNSLADVSVLADDNVVLEVKYTGEVEWTLPRIFTIHCDIDVSYYPFDTQTCAVELTSWAYGKSETEIRALWSTVNLEDIKQSGEWDVTQTSVTTTDVQETKSDGSVVSFSRVNFYLTLERKSSYYVTSVILPVLLISYLNSLVFILPVSSGEKIGCTLTILLALAVLLTLITDSIPSTSVHVCILSTYLATILCMGVLCTLLTVVVIRVYHLPDSEKMPKAMTCLMTKIIIPLSCWHGCCKSRNCRRRGRSGKAVVEPSEKHQKNNMFLRKSTLESDELPKKQKDRGKHEDTDAETLEEVDDADLFENWKEVSTILDRFFFVTTIFITTIMTIIFMFTLALGGLINNSASV